MSEFIFVGLRHLTRVARPIVKWLVGTAFERASFLLPVKRLYESVTMIAFWHPRPGYRIHLLLVPKKAVSDLSELNQTECSALLAETFQVIEEIIQVLGMDEESWRLVLNGGAFQEIPQLHFHLIVD